MNPLFDAAYQPWKLSTLPSPSSSMWLLLQSDGLVNTFPARSGWVVSTPESITPTITELLPVLCVQASVASMSASTVPPDWPVFFKPQSDVNSGSFGTTSVECTM